MSQAGFTPIQLYFSTTAAATPSAGNLANGELAINITDGKLYYKDNGGVVKLLASNAGSAGDVVGPASATDNALARFDTTTGKLIQNSVGILSDAGVLTGLTGLTSSGNVTLSALTSGRVPYASTGGLLVDSANLLYSGTDLTVYGITVGRGAGAVATNTAVGASALAGTNTGGGNVGVGISALAVNTGGNDNTAVGNSALAANTNAQYNTAIGSATLLANTTGANNTAVGRAALFSSTTASDNTAVGYEAGASATTSPSNVFVGYQAGRQGGAGASTFVGYRAGYTTGSGSNNTAFGYEALLNNASGVYNVAVGLQAARATTSSTNTAVGYQALLVNTTGADHTAIGGFALASNTTGSNNVAVGNSALTSNTTANNNTVVGNSAAYSNTTGTLNTVMGRSAFFSNTTGAQNSAFGFETMFANTTGGNNTAFGQQALTSNTTASNNTAVGYQAGYSNTTGYSIVAIGQGALYANTTGYENTAVGQSALTANTTGVYNTAVGTGALQANTTASNNTAVGLLAMRFNTTGGTNTGVGQQALYLNTTGASNTALGYQALQNNTTASRNTAIGYQAGYSDTTGFANLFVGYNSGRLLTTGTGNTMVGDSSGAVATTGNFNTFVGQASGSEITTGAKNTIIGTYNGNQGGLDIRTASNYVVLSDGDGVPHAYNGGSDWYLAPKYRSFLTRGNNGGDPSTGSSGNFFKVGTWVAFNQGARAALRIVGSTGFSAGDTNTGETVIYLVYQNSNDVDGFYYSVLGANSVGVNAVAVKNTGGSVEVWVKTGTFASTAVFPDCVLSRWEGAYSDTGSVSTPSGAKLLSNYFKYIDTGASDSAITLNQYGVGIGAAVGTSGRGITFPATQSASSNANTLDDYEEGTFTTTIAGEANVSAVTLTVGNYIKIGKQVTLFVKFGFTVTSANSYTYWNFTLPFTSDSANDNAGACVENNLGRIGGVTNYGSSTAAAYVVFPAASQLSSGTTACYISYTYRATA
jgi:hypothetical protein